MDTIQHLARHALSRRRMLLLSATATSAGLLAAARVAHAQSLVRHVATAAAAEPEGSSDAPTPPETPPSYRRHPELTWSDQPALEASLIDPATIQNGVRQIVIAGLGQVPYVGWLLAPLCGLLWPEQGPNPWQAIQQNVQALLNQAISAEIQHQVQEDLKGLIQVMDDYLQSSDSKDPSFIASNWVAARAAFDVTQPHFMAEGYEVLLLPLLAQMANLHLALLGDGVRFGQAQWNWAADYAEQIAGSLTKQAQLYQDYANSWIDKGHAALVLPTDGPHLATRRWQAMNAYDRQMVLAVRDNVSLWPYFDPSRRAGDGALLRLTREIFSDPQGTADDEPGGPAIPPHPSAPITRIQGWSFPPTTTFPSSPGSPVISMQLDYGGQTGPRMGIPGFAGWDPAPPTPIDVQVTPDKPVVAAAGYSGDILDAARFVFQGGPTTAWCGQNPPGGSAFNWQFDGHILSSITIMGRSHYFNCADCAVYGFRYADSYGPVGTQPPAAAPEVKFWAQQAPFGKKWKANTQVRYAISFVTPEGESDLGPWQAWAGSGYALAYLVNIPTDPSGHATRRNIYRQFEDDAPELIGTLDNNTDTAYQDEDY